MLVARLVTLRTGADTAPSRLPAETSRAPITR
jgi:hypothetical protein